MKKPTIVLHEDERTREKLNKSSSAETLKTLLPVRSALLHHAEQSPDKIALICGGTKLTFEQLHEQTSKFTKILQSQDIGPGDVVAVSMHRTLDLFIAIHSVVQSGATYLPISTNQPIARIQKIFDSSGAKLLLTQAELLTTAYRFLQGDANIFVDQFKSIIVCKSVNQLSAERKLADTGIYIIYTSGTTGTPKGILVDDVNLQKRIEGIVSRVALTEDDIFVALCDISFDVSIAEILLPMVLGSTVVFATDSEVDNGYELHASIDKHKVSVIQATPPTFKILLCCGWKNTRRMKCLCGGEPIQNALAEKLTHDGCKFYAVMGPSETIIYALIKEVKHSEPDYNYIPLGSVVPGTRAYVLSDSYVQLTDEGSEGELLISGPLALGYINSNDEGEKRFVNGNFLTGDLVKQHKVSSANTVLECRGRKDEQVKVRGFRVELGEVEVEISRAWGVSNVVVVPIHGSVGEKELVAFIVAGSDMPDKQHRLELATRLPDYMLPREIIYIKEIPLSKNKKTDRKKLIEEYEKKSKKRIPAQSSTDYVNRKLKSIFFSVTGKNFEDDDSIYEKGVNSLESTYIVARVSKLFNVYMTIVHLYESMTIRNIEHSIKNKRLQQAQSFSEIDRTTQGRVRASSAQERLWLQMKLEKNYTSALNIPYSCVLDFSVNVNALKAALRALVFRHDNLRARFLYSEDKLWIKITDQKIVRFTEISTKMSIGSDFNENMPNINKEIQKPFDIENDPLFRFIIVTSLTNGRRLLTICMHHLITDSWSEEVLKKELSTLYDLFMGVETEGELKKITSRGETFAILDTQRSFIDANVEKDDFWRTQLADRPFTHFQADKPRSGRRGFGGEYVGFSFDKETNRDIAKHAQLNNTTRFTVLLSFLSILITKYSRQLDLIVGVPYFERGNGTEGLVGCRVNIIPLRVNIESLSRDEMTLTNITRLTEQVRLQSIQHNVPYQTLVKLSRTSTAGNEPIVNVALVVDSNKEPFKFRGVKTQDVFIYNERSHFEIAVYVNERADGTLGCRLEYQTDLFYRETMEALARNFLLLSRGLLSNPNLPLDEVPWLGEVELVSLLQEQAGNIKRLPPEETIPSLFQRIVAANGESVALRSDSDELTYLTLYRKALGLKKVLEANNVAEGTLVPVCAKRGFDWIIGMLATSMAGAAYVSIDPSYPEEKIAYILRDINSKVMLVQVGTLNIISDIVEDDILLLSVDYREIEEVYEEIEFEVSPRDLAYVIYTSGTTGNSKGIEVEHKSLMNYTHEFIEWQGLKPNKKMLSALSQGFDGGAVWEIWGPLLSGATLVLSTKYQPMLGLGLLEVAKTNDINILILTPSMLIDIAKHLKQLSSLEAVYACGEDLPLELARTIIGQGKRLFNAYGPTETTVVSSMSEVTEDTKVITIGKPLGNIKYYVMNSKLQPVPDGAPGELCIGGDCLARGYHNLPELTQEKFIKHKLFGRMYLTGDLVVKIEDGSYRYRGRIDEQFKYRGYRIEAKEIETTIAGANYVDRALVRLAHDNGQPSINAYITLKKDELYSEFVVKERERHVLRWEEKFNRGYAQMGHCKPGGKPLAFIEENSFSGEPQVVELIDEMFYQTGERIKALCRRTAVRVLDVGCGSGQFSFYLMKRLSEGGVSCQYYGGIDVSSSAIGSASASLEETRSFSTVKPEFFQCEASDVQRTGRKKANLTIMINVVSYFPDLAYLTDSLNSACSENQDGGVIFIGGIRNFDLLYAFHAHVQMLILHKEKSACFYHQNIDKRLFADEHLAISPKYFTELMENNKSVTGVSIQLKRGHCNVENDILPYQYDATIYTDHSATSINELGAVEYGWGKGVKSEQELEGLLTVDRKPFLVKNIPNKRLYGISQVLSAAKDLDKTIGCLRSVHSSAEEESCALDPEKLCLLGESNGYETYVTYSDSSPFSFDILFYEPQPELTLCTYSRNDLVGSPSMQNSSCTLSNNPVMARIKKNILLNLRAHVEKSLSYYMRPRTITILESFPMTANGKVNTKTLPAPSVLSNYDEEQPETDVEKEIAAVWVDELGGVQNVGKYANWYDLGGDSSLFVRMLNRVEMICSVKIKTDLLAELPRLDRLAQLVASYRDEHRAPINNRKMAHSYRSVIRSRTSPKKSKGISPIRREGIPKGGSGDKKSRGSNRRLSFT